MKNKSAYVWGLLSRVGPAAIQILCNMVLARFLSVDDFGTIGVLTIIFMVANVLIDSGLGGSLVKEPIVTKIDCSTIGVFNICISIILYIFLFLLAPIIQNYYGIINLDYIVRILSLTFVIGSFGMVPKALLVRNLKFRTICIITLFSIIVASFVSISMAIKGFGVYSLVAYQLVNISLISLLSCFFAKFFITFRFSFSSLKHLFSFGFYTTITSIIDTIYENLLTSLTGKYLSVSQAGFLSQAKKIEDGMSTSIASTIGNISFPILTKLKENSIVFKKEAWSLLYIIMIFSFPILLIISVYSDRIIVLLFGETWLQAAFYLKSLIWAGLLLIIETTIRSFIKSLCEVKRLLNATIIKRGFGIAIIFLSLLVNPLYIVYAYILSTLIGLLINLNLYSKVAGIKFSYCIIKILKNSIPPLFFYFFILMLNRLLINYQLVNWLSSLLILMIYYLYFIIKNKSIIYKTK